MRGKMWRLMVLAGMCLAAAPVAAEGGSGSRISVDITTTLSTATFKIRTSTLSTKIVVSVGTDRQNLIGRSYNAPAGSLMITLSPLAPATYYLFRVTATDEGGTSTRNGTFTTGPVRAATLAANGGGFRLNGVKFFPIMARTFNQCSSHEVITHNVSMGVNIMDSWGGVGKTCVDYDNGRTNTVLTAEQLHAILKGDVWWLDRNTEVPMVGLPEALDLLGGFERTSGLGNMWDCGNKSADVLYNGVKADAARWAAEGKAVISGLLTTPKIVPHGQDGCLNAKRTTANFWVAVLAGAGGITYSTQYLQDPPAGVQTDNLVRQRAGAEAKHLATLYPCVLGRKTVPAASSNAEIKVKAWRWGSGTCVVALNTTNRSIGTRLTVGGGNTAARVLWENRGKSVKNGVISDSFGSLEVHIYRVGG